MSGKKTFITEGSFELKRSVLVHNSTDLIDSIVDANVYKDLSLGAEFILTAEDVLDRYEFIPSEWVSGAPLNSNINVDLIKLVL